MLETGLRNFSKTTVFDYQYPKNMSANMPINYWSQISHKHLSKRITNPDILITGFNNVEELYADWLRTGKHRGSNNRFTD